MSGKKIEAMGLDHAVIFTTHATLMDHGLEGFDGLARPDRRGARSDTGRPPSTSAS